MSPRTAFRKSLLLAPIEGAFRRAETEAELVDAWADWASGFADDSQEREHLLSAYDRELERVKKRASDADAYGKYLRTL